MQHNFFLKHCLVGLVAWRENHLNSKHCPSVESPWPCEQYLSGPHHTVRFLQHPLNVLSKALFPLHRHQKSWPPGETCGLQRACTIHILVLRHVCVSDWQQESQWHLFPPCSSPVHPGPAIPHTSDIPSVFLSRYQKSLSQEALAWGGQSESSIRMLEWWSSKSIHTTLGISWNPHNHTFDIDNFVQESWEGSKM